MKKLMFAACAAVAVLSVQAYQGVNEAKKMGLGSKITPVMWSVAPDQQSPVGYQDADVRAFRLTLIDSECQNMHGGDVGLIRPHIKGFLVGGQLSVVMAKIDGNLLGGQVAWLARTDGKVMGGQYGIVTSSGTLQAGAQVGIANKTGLLRGFQIGIVNHADKRERGLQIGILNHIPGSKFPWFPIVNGCF